MLLAGSPGCFTLLFALHSRPTLSPRIRVSGPATSLGVSLSFYRHCSVPFLVSVLGILNRNYRQSPTQPWYFLWQEVFSSALVSGIGKVLYSQLGSFSNHQTPIRGCRLSDFHFTSHLKSHDSAITLSPRYPMWQKNGLH